MFCQKGRPAKCSGMRWTRRGLLFRRARVRRTAIRIAGAATRRSSTMRADSWFIKMTAVKAGSHPQQQHRSTGCRRASAKGRFGRLAGKCAGLGYQPQPLLGHAAEYLGMRVRSPCMSVGSIEELRSHVRQLPGRTSSCTGRISMRSTITCPHCGKQMKRVPEVIDCWFDSGSMPFAQYHYPV